MAPNNFSKGIANVEEIVKQDWKLAVFVCSLLTVFYFVVSSILNGSRTELKKALAGSRAKPSDKLT